MTAMTKAPEAASAALDVLLTGRRRASPDLTFERAAGGKPVCVANALYRVYEQR
jgi:hypothetical protein